MSKFNAIRNLIILICFLWSPLAQAKPCANVDYIIGESIAWMMQRNLDCKTKHFYQDAEPQRTPSMVLNAILSAKRGKPHIFDETNVILSSGASNDPGRNLGTPTITQLDKIERQLQELSSAKHIYLLGVGPGYYSNLKLMEYNSALETLSKKYSNVSFGGPLITYKKDPVHLRPRPHTDYQDLYDQLLQDTKT